LQFRVGPQLRTHYSHCPFAAGPFAGVRAISNLKPDLLSLKVISLAEGVNVPLLGQFTNKEGRFVPNEIITRSANIMLTQLVRWTKGIKAIKEDTEMAYA